MRDHGGMRWWRDPRGRNRAFVAAFAVLALIGMLLPGIFNRLLAGDSRQLVVSLQQPVAQAERERVKQTCGALPGVEIVPDDVRPELAARFPLRFRISGSTQEQERALQRCLDDFGPLVRGVQNDRDRS